LVIELPERETGEVMSTDGSWDEVRDVAAASAGPAAGEEQPPAWEQIENGRYMPRRVRGSCLGRELG
jgi:hypothetical protein